MHWGNPSTWLLALLVALLVSAAVEDVRTREIANWKNAVIALTAPLWWWASGLSPWPDAAIQLAVAAAVLGAFAAAFAFGWMGGGDVKLLAALALWLPVWWLPTMLVVMSLIGAGVTLAAIVHHRWRRHTSAVEVPYGVAIAAAALIAFREPILNHFT